MSSKLLCVVPSLPVLVRCVRYSAAFQAIIQPSSCHCFLTRDYFRTAASLARKRDETKSVTREKKKKPLIEVWKDMTVADFAKQIDKPIDGVIHMLRHVPNGAEFNTPHSPITDHVVVANLAKRFDHGILKVRNPATVQLELQDTPDINHMPPRPKDLALRPPVVTIMGHVDHGKTTLLDSLRHSNVVESEAGGITQAIGAFQVNLNGKLVTFIDTPGHAAFWAMRNRGAHSTDIVVLVVAGDDGVMEQTRESIRMAQDAGVPMIVAINKIDRKDADIDRTKKMLLQEGIQLEDFGGDVMVVPVSALKSINLDALVEAILTQAEFIGLKAEKQGPIEGVVLESSIDAGRGKLATILVQRGMLKKSAVLVAGCAWAKVRNMYDEKGKILKQAGPSTPVELIGWRDLPSAGDKIFEVDSEQRAKAIVDYRKAEQMTEKAVESQSAIKHKLEEWHKEYKARLDLKRQLGWYRVHREGPREKEFKEDDSGIPQLNVVIKGDVDGSVESLLDVFDSYDCAHQCRLEVVHYGIGDVTENDIKLAETFEAIIYGFNVKMPSNLEPLCDKSGVQFRQSKIIYRLVEALKNDLTQRIPPKEVVEPVGQAEVLQVFTVTEGKKKLPVCGSKCTTGVLKKSMKFKLVREDQEIFDGTVYSMRHLKNEVNSVSKDIECGICLQDLDVEPKLGDSLICYRIAKVPVKTEWQPVGF